MTFLAIAVFGITCLALLSPWISPLWPTGLAVTLLGFLTLDRAYASGAFTQRFGVSQELQHRIAYHEAGHFLAAALLGLPIDNYALGNRTGYLSLWVPAEVSPQRQMQIATIYMAGIAAEEWRFQSELEDTGGRRDRQELRQMLHRCGDPHPEVSERWALYRARTLMREHAPALDALAAAMEQGSSPAECLRAIMQHTEFNTVPTPWTK
jgi:hypothetical protein